MSSNQAFEGTAEQAPSFPILIIRAAAPQLIVRTSPLPEVPVLLFTFLNVLGLSVGAMSALFFAAGALFVSTDDLYEITSGAWDVERHRWGDSIAGQRADYIVGALLLLVSFGLQLAANLVPVDAAPSLFQPLGCAIAEIVAGVSLLVVCSVFLRNANAHATREKLRKMRAAEMSRIDSLGQQS